VFRVLRPYGGVACFGQPSTSGALRGVDLEEVKQWLAGGGMTGIEEVRREGAWAKVGRGELVGAGSWTEQYGNPQNTACSGDELVGGQLGVLWFGEPGPKGILERHAKASSPVALNGRFFKQGEEIISAYDSYNGTLIWERRIPGAVRARADVDGGNLSLTEDGLYVAAYDKCYRLDPATGVWAVSGDGSWKDKFYLFEVEVYVGEKKVFAGAFTCYVLASHVLEGA